MKNLILFVLAAMPIATSIVAADPVSKELKRETVETLFKEMDESYVFPELVTKAKSVVSAKQSSGEYDKIETGEAFAAALRADINAILKDAHFKISYSKDKLPERQVRSEPNPAEIAQGLEIMRRRNAGVERAERMAGNVGYIEVTSFSFTQGLAEPLKAAMDLVANTDALILDLRRNGGGDPQAVRMLCSYFFGSKPVHLNDIYFRTTNKTDEFWTTESVPGKRYLDREVYVLTGPNTASAAEECSYNLQNLKRATIVGAPTWGGANPGGNYRLNDHFSAFIPNGRAINPITKTNWEGVGIQPHVKVSPEEALRTAHVLALKALVAKAKTPEEKEWRQFAVDAVEGKKG